MAAGIWRESSDLKHSAGHFLAREEKFIICQVRKCGFYLHTERGVCKQFKKLPSLFFVISAFSTVLLTQPDGGQAVLHRELQRGRGWYDSVISEGEGICGSSSLAFWTKIRKEPCCCHVCRLKR